MPLTDLQIRNATAKAKPYKIADSEGLFLYVTPAGSKLWRMKFRYAGREKLLSFGKYPTISLADARSAKADAKRLLAAGKDPAFEKGQAKLRFSLSRETTFTAVSNSYLRKLEQENKAPSTLKKNRWLQDKAINAIGNVQINELSAPQVLHAVRKVQDRGTIESARRLKTFIGSVCRYAVASGLADNDPTTALNGALLQPVANQRAAITDPEAFGGLLRVIDGFDGYKVTQLALQLLALLHTRPGELRLSKWEEFDLEKAIWTVPAERMKTRKEHKVPLPKQAMAILLDAKAAGMGSDFVFPSIKSTRQPLSENTFNAALRRMGYTKDEMTAHGFRASFSTIANDSGKWRPDVIERALAHQEQNSIRRAYNRSEYWPERVELAQWWADHCDHLKGIGR